MFDSYPARGKWDWPMPWNGNSCFKMLTLPYTLAGTWERAFSLFPKPIPHLTPVTVSFSPSLCLCPPLLPSRSWTLRPYPLNLVRVSGAAPCPQLLSGSAPPSQPGQSGWVEVTPLALGGTGSRGGTVDWWGLPRGRVPEVGAGPGGQTWAESPAEAAGGGSCGPRTLRSVAQLRRRFPLPMRRALVPKVSVGRGPGALWARWEDPAGTPQQVWFGRPAPVHLTQGVGAGGAGGRPPGIKPRGRETPVRALAWQCLFRTLATGQKFTLLSPPQISRGLRYCTDFIFFKIHF